MKGNASEEIYALCPLDLAIRVNFNNLSATSPNTFSLGLPPIQRLSTSFERFEATLLSSCRRYGSAKATTRS